MLNSSVKSQMVFFGIMMVLLCLCGVAMSNFTDNPKMREAACGRPAVQLLPCLPALAGSGSKPSAQCCTVLSVWGFCCLCDLLGYNHCNIPGNINRTKILDLPKVCGLQVPAGMKCGGKSATVFIVLLVISLICSVVLIVCFGR